jgi:hypothetical protein
MHAAELVSLAGGLIGMFPNSLQGLAGPFASQLPVTPFNLVCTNVPGPQFPLYLLGRKMLSCYPYVPVGGEMAVNCAILSYNGSIYVGFSGDVHAAPDLSKLETLLQHSFGELRDAAGIRPEEKKKERTPKDRKPKEKKTMGTQPPRLSRQGNGRRPKASTPASQKSNGAENPETAEPKTPEPALAVEEPSRAEPATVA